MVGTYLSILRRRWSLVVLATLILAPMAFLALTSSSGIYRSTAVIQVLNASVTEGVLGTSRTYQDPERLLASEIEVLNSRVVAEGAAERLRAQGWSISADAVREAVQVAPRGLSSYIEVVGSHQDAAAAQELTDAFVESYQEYKLALQRGELEQLNEELQARLAATEAELVRLDAPGVEETGALARQQAAVLGRYQSLSSLIEDVRLRLSVDTSGVEVLTPASEAELSTGALDPVPAAVVSVVAAVALASGIALLLDLLRDPVRTREEAERLLPEASVVVIPRPAGDRSDWLSALEDVHSRESRAARTAQERWRPRIKDSGGRLVVSGEAGDREHPVYVATGLAAAAGRAGLRVLFLGEPLDRSAPESAALTTVAGGAHDELRAVPTTLPRVWWAATADGVREGVGDVVTGSAEGIDVVIRVREDGIDSTDTDAGPPPFTVVVATLGRTRAAHLRGHVRELEAAGLLVGGLALVEADHGRPSRGRRRSGQRPARDTGGGRQQRAATSPTATSRPVGSSTSPGSPVRDSVSAPAGRQAP